MEEEEKLNFKLEEIFGAGTEALGSKAVDEKVSEISARKLELGKSSLFLGL